MPCTTVYYLALCIILSSVLCRVLYYLALCTILSSVLSSVLCRVLYYLALCTILSSVWCSVLSSAVYRPCACQGVVGKNWSKSCYGFRFHGSLRKKVRAKVSRVVL